MFLHFEVDKSFSFLNFNLCYLSGLLKIVTLPSSPPTPLPHPYAKQPHSY